MKQFIKKFRTGGIVLADQAVVSGSNFLLGVLLTRELGLAGFGTYSLLWMGVLFALSLNHAFISQAMLSLGPKQKLEDYLPVVLSLQTGFSILAATITVIVLFCANSLNFLPAIGSYLVLFPPLIACYLFYDYCRKYFFLIRQPEWAFAIDTFYALVLFGLLFWKAWTGNLSIYWTINSLLIAQGAAICLSLWKLPKPVSNWEKIKEVLEQHYQFSKMADRNRIVAMVFRKLFPLGCGCFIRPRCIRSLANGTKYCRSFACLVFGNGKYDSNSGGYHLSQKRYAGT